MTALPGLAARITEARLDARMTQHDLAKALGVSFQTVRQWETGMNNPSLERLVDLAQVLRTKVSRLLGEE